MRSEIVYHGRVQGVGFRATAKRLADEHGVVGWARNEADGSVRVVAEGPSDRVAAFRGAIRDRLGDFISREDIVADGEDTGRYAGFEIR